MTNERTALWTRRVLVNLDPDDAPGKPPRPACCASAAGASSSGSATTAARRSRRCARTSRRSRRRCRRSTPTCTACATSRRPSTSRCTCAATRCAWATPCRAASCSVLSPGERTAFTDGQRPPRAGAATIGSQPIALRVIVNRVWKEHFGTGLVDTPSNFGLNGERPTHPELLDYLAQYFVDHGMSIKALHREILRSGSISSAPTRGRGRARRTRGNRLYWRANRRRLQRRADPRRACSPCRARSTRSIGGPSVPLTPLGDRRTIYGKVSRYKLDEFLQLFDFPSPSQTAEQRFSTNVPLQRLFFMNSDFVQQHAERLAERVADEPDDAARIDEGLPPDLRPRRRRRRRPRRPRLPEGRGAEAVRGAAGREGGRDQATARPRAGAPTPPRGGRCRGEDAPADGMMAGVDPGREAASRRSRQDAAGHRRSAATSRCCSARTSSSSSADG